MPRADGITVSLDGDQAVIGRISDLAARMDDLTPMMEDIGATMERNVNLRFDTKRDPSGRSWAPLAPSTLELYAKADGDRRQGTLLERTGLMRSSLNYLAGPTFVEWGFGRPYAVYHEFSAKRMPRRGLLTENPEAGTLGQADTRDLLSVVNSYLLGS